MVCVLTSSSSIKWMMYSEFFQGTSCKLRIHLQSDNPVSLFVCYVTFTFLEKVYKTPPRNGCDQKLNIQMVFHVNNAK
jgi:hypothetical protein